MYRMVIVDDEKWVARSLVSTIRGQGWFELVGEAYDGVSGLSLLRQEAPELAFIDVQMPGMSGLELLRRATELSLPTQCVMISGHAEFAYAQKAMFFGAISYCLKPFSKNELLDSMEKAYNRLRTVPGTRGAPPVPAPAAPAEAPPTVPPVQPLPKTSNRMVNQMLAFIHERFGAEVSVRDLAALCGINPNYAGQLFRQVTGETISGYLTRIRMERAGELLAHTELSVSAIAAQVGFSDYFYFAKVFKRHTGVTPSGYRRS